MVSKHILIWRTRWTVQIDHLNIGNAKMGYKHMWACAYGSRIANLSLYIYSYELLITCATYYLFNPHICIFGPHMRPHAQNFMGGTAWHSEHDCRLHKHMQLHFKTLRKIDVFNKKKQIMWLEGWYSIRKFIFQSQPLTDQDNYVHNIRMKISVEINLL